MKIIICDDEKEMLDKIEDSCENMNVCKADIRTYISSKKLCEFLVEKQPEVDLFILDIEMPDVDGLELKKLISGLYIDTAIIFITSHDEMMEDAFGKKVLGFLTKEDYEERLSICIKELQEELSKTDFLIFIDTGKEKNIRLSQIVTIRAEHIYTLVDMAYCYNSDLKQYETIEKSYRITIKKWEEMLNKDFFKVNRSLIIHLRHVDKIHKDVTLDTGEIIKISPKRIKALKDAFNHYCDKMARCVL